MTFRKIFASSILIAMFSLSAQANTTYFFLSCMLGEESGAPWIHVKFDREAVNPADGIVSGEVSYQDFYDFENPPNVTVLGSSANLEVHFGGEKGAKEKINSVEGSWNVARSLLSGSLKIDISDEVAIDSPFVKFYRSYLTLRDPRISIETEAKCRLTKSGDPRPGVSGGN